MKITLDLDDKTVKGLLHWHHKSADFGDVEHETGADLITTVNALAAKTASHVEIDALLATLVED